MLSTKFLIVVEKEKFNYFDFMKNKKKVAVNFINNLLFSKILKGITKHLQLYPDFLSERVAYCFQTSIKILFHS